MPRKARVVLPACPHHVVHRGHNRDRVFLRDGDYVNYLRDLREWKEVLGCRLYAYCLMTNHVHLVVDSGDNAKSLGLLMKRIAARHTRRVNRREGRSGTLWEGRFKSSPIDSERYLLACCRYVEMNPVRAEITPVPEGYPWSSYRSRSGLVVHARLVDALPSAATVDARNDRPDSAVWYREWVNSPVPHGEWDLLRRAVNRGQLSGDDRFIDEVSLRIGRRVELRGPGHPRRTATSDSESLCQSNRRSLEIDK